MTDRYPVARAVPTTMAQRVRAWRERARMSQVEAAQWYGVNPRTWQRWESGRTAVPLPVQRRLSIGGFER
jgi:DNA-binding transcriptional regulator YiaG